MGLRWFGFFSRLLPLRNNLFLLSVLSFHISQLNIGGLHIRLLIRVPVSVPPTGNTIPVCALLGVL